MDFYFYSANFRFLNQHFCQFLVLVPFLLTFQRLFSTPFLRYLVLIITLIWSILLGLFGEFEWSSSLFLFRPLAYSGLSGLAVITIWLSGVDYLLANRFIFYTLDWCQTFTNYLFCLLCCFCCTSGLYRITEAINHTRIFGIFTVSITLHLYFLKVEIFIKSARKIILGNLLALQCNLSFLYNVRTFI